MLTTHHGILLKQVAYSDTSLILTFFTREAGLISFMHKGARRSKRKQAMVPLSLWEIEASGRSGKLAYIKELTPSPALPSIPQDMMKSSVILFLNELLVQVLREEGENEQIHAFVTNSLIHFDHHPFDPDFHLKFMFHLSEYLGFTPHLDDGAYFDLQNGETVHNQPNGPYLEGRSLMLFRALSDERDLNVGREERQVLLDELLMYFRLHVEGMKELNSQEVLETVFE